MTNNHIQTYTCENGARAKFIIPENASKDDLLALKKIVNEIIEQKVKEHTSCQR